VAIMLKNGVRRRAVPCEFLYSYLRLLAFALIVLSCGWPHCYQTRHDARARQLSHAFRTTLWPFKMVFTTIKRKLSRTKSESMLSHEQLEALKAEALRRETRRERRQSLTPSDENLMSKIQSSPETELPVARPRQIRFVSTPAPVRASPRTVFNDTTSGLLSLPTEILVVLQPYLRPSAEVSLRNTCSRFLHLYSTPALMCLMVLL